jgi:hypothetical protein
MRRRQNMHRHVVAQNPCMSRNDTSVDQPASLLRYRPSALVADLRRTHRFPAERACMRCQIGTYVHVPWDKLAFWPRRTMQPG